MADRPVPGTSAEPERAPGRGLVLAAVVLAAGAGSRYSDDPGSKLGALLHGRPLLAHVLAEVRAARPHTTVVVLGHGAGRIEHVIEWAGELRVVNHEPARGLASSLQVGIDALRALPDTFDGAFIVLGDQPYLRSETMDALAYAAATTRPADRPVIVPRYARAGPRNPVLLLRPAWSWVDRLEGDTGLAPLIQARPDAVLEIAVPGDMPDVDTPADLARLERDATA